MASHKNKKINYNQEHYYRNMKNTIAFFTLILLCIYPLAYHNYYFDILKFKYQFYYLTIFIMTSLLLIQFIQMCSAGHCKTREIKIKKRIIPPDLALSCFLLIALISTLLSNYRYEAFWGNEGRYTGLFLLLVYGLGYFIISKGLDFKPWMLDLCLITGMLVCVFGITDYFDLDILGFKTRIADRDYDIFTSTLGNINTYTAFVAMIMGMSAVLFATAKTKIRTGVYLSFLVISFFAIIMGISDNAYLAVAGLLAFLPLYLFCSYGGIRRYIVILASFFSVIQCIDWINQVYQGELLPLDGVFQLITGYRGLFVIVIGLWALVAVLYLHCYIKKDLTDNVGSKARNVWLVMICCFAVGLIYLLYDVNIAGRWEQYGDLAHYLKFTDDWGTNRGYIWRIAIENYQLFSPIHKIFGYGPDTFGIVAINNNYNYQFFDSAHNEYLQYFITIGPLGLISYLWFLGSAGIVMVKKKSTDPYIMAILFALLCYAVQAVVNINLPIAAAFMWTLLMVGLAGCRSDHI